MKIPLVLCPATAGIRSRRSAEPVTFGIPLPKGLLQSPEGWTLQPADGPASIVDARVLDRWADGSARWVLADTVVNVEPGRPHTWSLDTDPDVSTSAGAPSGMTVADTADGVLVDTGSARFTIARGGLFPLNQVSVGGQPVLDPARSSGLTVTDASGQTTSVRVDRVAVTHAGRLRVSVRVDGTVTTSEGRRLVVEGRVECFAGLSTVRVLCTIRNPDRAKHPGNYWDLGDAGSVLLKDVSLTLAMADTPAPPSIRLSTETGTPWAAASAPVEIYQDSSGGEYWQSTNHINRKREVPNSFRGYRLREGGHETPGLRATPAVVVDAGDRRLAAAMPDFWQTFPKALETDGRGLTARFFPGQYADLHELQGGEQKTHECFLGFGLDTISEEPLDWCRGRTLVGVAPAWVIESNAVDFLAPLDAAHGALADQAIEGPNRFEVKREVIDQYGWRHYGEIYGDHEAIGHTGPAPLVSHYNNQYDPVAGFALQFLRTGDRRWWAAMNELGAHVIDVDIYHTDRDKAAYNGGLFWHTYHYGDADTATHRTYPLRNNGKVFGGGPSADHNYPTGLMLRYYLTGDEASREAAVGLAQYVLNLDDWRLSPFKWLSRADTGRTIFTPPDFFGPARSSGNSLNALVDGHRLTGEARFLEKADQLVRRVVHPKDDLRRFRLDEPEYRWFYAMFLQALGKYLQYKAERGLVDDAYAHGRASLLHYAQWMAEHEYPYLERPEKLEYPTETWAAQDIRKSDILYYAAMHASGADRERFAERADFFHRTSTATLAGMPTRVLARPVIVLLTSGFLRPWFASHRQSAMPPPAHIPDFGMPERFVPQRARAERRAKIILAIGALGGMMAVAAVGWLWLF